MSGDTYGRSGSLMPPGRKPVEILEIGRPGVITEVIIHNGKIYVYNAAGQTLIDGGIVQTAGIAAGAVSAVHLNVGEQAFVHDIAFSGVAYNKVDWGAGTIYWANGSNASINAGTTGTFSGIRYIYYNNSANLAVTANIADTIGNNKQLIATVQSAASGGTATIELARSPGTTINASQVITGTLIGILLTVGTSNSIFKVTTDGIHLGHANFASAPFRVNMAGAAVMTSATITGYIPTGGAAADVNTGATEISPGKILISGSTSLDDWRAAGDLTKIEGGSINTNSVNANVMKTSTLSVALSLGVANIKLDGANKYILMNDGVDRLLLGYLVGGF